MSDRAAALRAFAYGDFRTYQLARFVSVTATQAGSVVIGWQVYAITHHPLDLGFVGLAQFLPAFGLALVTGAVADRFERRAVVVACNALMMVGWAALWWIARHGVATVWPVYAVLVLMGVARAFAAPAQQALVPNLVPVEALGSAITWGSIVWQTAAIAGPAVGGLLYARFEGAAPVYAVSAAGALVTAALVATLDPPPRAKVPRKATSWSELLAGVRYVWREKLVLGAISLDLFAVLLGGAVALLPVFARDVLHADARALGWLRSAPAAGAAAMALWLGFRPLHRAAGAWLFGAVGLFGLATVGFALSRSLWLSLACLFVTGAADMVSVVVRQHAVQVATPDAMRGRVGAVNQVFVGASNELGEFESGLTAEWLGPVRAALVGGWGTLAVVMLWSMMFPSLRRLDRLDEVRAKKE